MNRTNFYCGIRDGFPIGLGYFAVAFSLGIVAQNAGLTPLQGFIASFFNKAPDETQKTTEQTKTPHF